MLSRVVKFIAIAVSLFGMQYAFAAVEINTADQAQLDSVAGIGPATSRAILDERKKNGNYKDWADLEQRVRGIGERNAVKLSAAGLQVNGQPRNTMPASDKLPQAVKVAKPVKEPKGAGKESKDTAEAADAPKGGEVKR